MSGAHTPNVASACKDPLALQTEVVLWMWGSLGMLIPTNATFICLLYQKSHIQVVVNLELSS